MEGNLAGLDFSILLIDFVSNEDDGDVITDSGQVFVPLGDILVGDSGGDIEHKNGSMCTDIVTLSETSEFFLSCCIPESEFDRSVVGVEGNGADFDSLGGDVLLFELSGDMSFNKGGFSDSSVSDEDDLELGNNFGRFHVINMNHKVENHL